MSGYKVKEHIEIATDDLHRVLFCQISNTGLLSPNATKQVGKLFSLCCL